MNTYNYQYQNPVAPQYGNFQQIQQMFPQPQGSVYSINTPAEIGNVPIGSTGLSIALCLNDQIMYIKSFQNGAPVVMAYKISPFQKEEPPTTSAPEPQPELASRLQSLEEKMDKLIKGERFNGLL